MEQTTIDKRIFIKIEICVWEGKVMASGSGGGSSTDVATRWKDSGYSLISDLQGKGQGRHTDQPGTAGQSSQSINQSKDF